jgi:hypothetical protein
MTRIVSAICLTGFLLSALVGLQGCSSTQPRRDPVGEVFPSVVGTSLAGDEVRIPEDLSGEPALLLVGFKMDSQFDLDRWLLGIQQADIQVRAYELPTIPGMLPGLFAGRIDEGMRSGIPEEDWASVVTLYDDAPAVVRFVGNENPLPGRILLLDGKGRVVFFHDQGYSAGTLARLEERLAALHREERDTGSTR